MTWKKPSEVAVMPFYSSTLCGGGGQRGVQDHHWLHLKLEVNLSYMRLCLNKQVSTSSDATHCILWTGLKSEPEPELQLREVLEWPSGVSPPASPTHSHPPHAGPWMSWSQSNPDTQRETTACNGRPSLLVAHLPAVLQTLRLRVPPRLEIRHHSIGPIDRLGQ